MSCETCDRLVRQHAADRVFLRRGERGIFFERGEGGGVGLVGDVGVVEPFHELDRLAFAAVADPVELVDDVGPGPVEGDFARRRGRWGRAAAVRGGDVLRQAVVADEEFELAAIFADGELDRARFAGRVGMFDRVTGGGNHTFAELLADGRRRAATA